MTSGPRSPWSRRRRSRPISLRRWLARLEGEQTFGRGRAFWVVVARRGRCWRRVYPLFADGYTVGNLAYFRVWIFMAIGPVA